MYPFSVVMDRTEIEGERMEGAGRRPRKRIGGSRDILGITRLTVCTGGDV